MQPEVTLIFKDEAGHMRDVTIRSWPFTIGRSPDGDLTVNDSNLSRRHAVIENIRDRVRVSDCGSRNGTTVNHQPIAGATELCDGDVITLGGACDITVALQSGTASSTPVSFNPPVVAGAAVIIILSIAAALLINSARDDSNKPLVENNATSSSVGEGGGYFGNVKPPPSKPKSDPEPDASTTESSADTNTADADTAEQIGRAVKRTMSTISNDGSPYISEAGINDVARKVREYRGSPALRERLRAMKRSCPQVAAQAQSINLKPALVMYAALAESEGGAGGDPAAAAQRMMPKLLTLRATFGTETANSSLLLVAAYPYPFNPPIGSQTRTPHPLASKLMEFGGRRSTVDTSEARSVWFLREKNGITPEAYDLVVRLLAIGVIAQNPSRYEVDVDPLLC